MRSPTTPVTFSPRLVSGHRLVAVFLAACTPTPDLPAPAPVPPPAPSAPAGPKLPPRVDRPASVACELEGAGLPESATLKLGADWPEYAVVKGAHDAKGAKARLVLPVERGDQGAWLEIERGGVVLSGAIRADAVTLYPARPLAVGDLVTLKPAARLRWLGGSAGRVRAEFVPRNRVDRNDGKTYGIVALTAGPQDLACADVSVTPKSFEARPKDPTTDGKWESLSAEGDVLVSPAPGAKPQVTLRFSTGRMSPDAPLVFVEEKRGAEARVVVSRDDAVVVGWVPSAGMRPMHVRDAAEFGMIGLLDSGSAAPAAPRTVTCTADVPLVAGRDGRRATVGQLRAGAAFAPGERGEDLTRVEVVLPEGITLTEGASLYVPTAALAGCAAGGEAVSPRDRRAR